MRDNSLQILFLALLIIVAGCQTSTDSEQANQPNQTKAPEASKPKIPTPTFNADSAYLYIEKQVAMGPRVPGTPTQKVAADWLASKLREFGAEVTVQESTVTVYDGTKVPMYNIIGAYKPEAKKRVALFAHWDTRPFADMDTERKDEPILGANDGGSGVGVLLEIARQLQKTPANVGVDIILFDVEDYGVQLAETYCLGSQYWAQNPHKAGYKANFGILLDMVGAKGATFNQEGYSLLYAKNIVKKVWKAANRAGYSSYFPYRKVSTITDDHLFVNKIARIPTIDIIQFDETTERGFGDFWHTHDDNMDIISTKTLKAVGQTVMETIYSE